MSCPTPLLTGGCLCGASAHVVAWMTVQRSGLRQLGEPPREYASSPGATRGFCAR